MTRTDSGGIPHRERDIRKVGGRQHCFTGCTHVMFEAPVHHLSVNSNRLSFRHWN